MEREERRKNVSLVEMAGQLSSVQSFSCVRLFAAPWTAAHQASLSSTNSWRLLKLMFIESLIHPTISCKLCGIDTVARKEDVSYYFEWHY